jgi:hypothetical protein
MKKSESALTRAINQVLGFEAANAALKTSLIIRQRSPLTYIHYAQKLAKYADIEKLMPQKFKI